MARAVYPGYHVGPHHIAIADALEGVATGDLRRVIIEVPPRHGKSLLTSVIFPPWYLGHNPDGRIIACSYSSDLAHTFSRQARNMVADDPAYRAIFPEIKVASDSRSVGMWDLADHRGGYVAAGVGGSITGKGAHVLLIDDPVKDAEEAGSKTILDSIWEWYGSTAYTRLEGEGAVIVIMTRWAEDDLVGRLLDAAEDPEADQWHVVRLPALAEEHDPLGRPLGASLWPEKYDAEALRRIRTTLGARAFSALYQQRPAPAEGAIFKREWWQRYPPAQPDASALFVRSLYGTVIQVWDTAFQAKETADYSVCATWAARGNNAYLLDMFRGRLEFPELKRKAKDQAAKWRPNAVLIENKASGQSLIQELKHETQLPIVGVDVDRDKVSRAHAVTPYIEGGRAFLPERASWADTFIEEHAAFPAGAHDDIVDTTTMALRRLFGGATIPTGLPVGVTRQSPWKGK